MEATSKLENCRSEILNFCVVPQTKRSLFLFIVTLVTVIIYFDKEYLVYDNTLVFSNNIVKLLSFNRNLG